MKRIYIPKKETKVFNTQTVLISVFAFFVGSFITGSVILNTKLASITNSDQAKHNHLSVLTVASSAASCTENSSPQRELTTAAAAVAAPNLLSPIDGTSRNPPPQVRAMIQNTKILVAIAAFDFAQIPHLEEVLDSYHDLCVAGAALVTVVIHATVAYPVTLIDLLNTRFNCEAFSLQIVLKPTSLRLHLVDCHRPLFYEKLHDYDLFIYTEDDIRVTPTTVATYLYETARLARQLQETDTKNPHHYVPSDFNVGIVRYEYNYPPNVIIDDKTRHATQNVTRVYWEHSGFERPVVPNCLMPAAVKDKTPGSVTEQLHSSTDDAVLNRYLSMKNHHQGMFLATRELLQAWKDRPNCEFDKVRNRPGRGSQPTEGTQRVWMSSQMLYGGRHCGVTQIIPKESFGALTVLHLPNKNYRRVGTYRNRTFSDGSEVFQQPHSSLLSAMELHLGMRLVWPSLPQKPYRGIQMIVEVDEPRDRSPLLERRLMEYRKYVERGGVLSKYDMTRTDLVEPE